MQFNWLREKQGTLSCCVHNVKLLH